MTVRNLTQRERRDLNRVFGKLIFEAGYDEALSPPLVAMLDSAATTSPLFNRVGDSSLLPLLATSSSVLELHVSTTGSDLTGDGRTQTTAWATIQQAFDSIPNGALGRVFVRLHGVGPWAGVNVRDYKSTGVFRVFVIGDTDTPLETFTMAAGTQVPNGAGSGVDGFKSAVFNHNVGAYSTVITNTSHWLEVPGVGFSGGFLLDGLNGHCTSPNIRIASGYDASQFYSTLKLQAYKSRIETTNDFAYLTCEVPLDPNRQQVYFVGCIIGGIIGDDTTYGCTLRNVGLDACLCPKGIFDLSEQCYIFAHTQDEITLACTGRNHYYNSSIVFGIFDTSASGFGQNINIFAPSLYLGGICRMETINIASIMVGVHSGGAAAPGTALAVDNFDAEGITAAFYFEKSSGRFNNGGTCSVENVSQFIFADRHSRVEVNGSVFGRTTGVPFKIGFSSVMEISLPTGAPYIRNTDGSGHNIIVGGLATAVDYNALPKTDASLIALTPDLVLFARAQS